jgi:hypothetical protein
VGTKRLIFITSCHETDPGPLARLDPNRDPSSISSAPWTTSITDPRGSNPTRVWEKYLEARPPAVGVTMLLPRHPVYARKRQ